MRHHFWYLHHALRLLQITSGAEETGNRTAKAEFSNVSDLGWLACPALGQFAVLSVASTKLPFPV